MSQTLESLQTQYKALTGKAPHHKKNEENLEKEIKEVTTLRAQLTAISGEEPEVMSAKNLKKAIEDLKSKDEAPDIDLGELGVLRKGNMTDVLEDDNYFKDYSFEDVVVAPVSKSRPRAIKSSDCYHIGIIPAMFMNDTRVPLYTMSKNKQMPFRTLVTREQWQTRKPIYEKSTNMIFHVLHDPTKK